MKKVCVVTLGCKVNQYESDCLIAGLLQRGYQTASKLCFADVFVINTCAVTAEAEKKSRQMIARCKKYNKDAKIIVCGCASQNLKDQFLGRADLVFGTANKQQIIDKIDALCAEVAPLSCAYENMTYAKQSKTRAYIKIQDGCNNFCSYCLIPFLRGRSRSRSMQDIIAEAQNLGDDIKEIVLIGINITDYKQDGKLALIDLCEKLDSLGKRIRLGSIEESIITEQSLQRLKELKNFCPHFHLSLQSGSDVVLKKMNRKYTSSQFLQTTQNIRKMFNDANITTDVIVGFPAETEQEFEKSVSFIKKCEFSYLHVFPYSVRPNTVASKMPQISPETKSKRVKILEDLNSVLQASFVAKNQTASVLIEEFDGTFNIGHSKNFLKCYIKSDKDQTNSIVFCNVTDIYKDGAICKVITT